jgi:hypothetical protein
MPDDTIRIGHLISAELLTALKAAFPLDRPRERDSERSIWIKSGNQEVIEFLAYHHGETFQQSMEQ